MNIIVILLAALQGWIYGWASAYHAHPLDKPHILRNPAVEALAGILPIVLIIIVGINTQSIWNSLITLGVIALVGMIANSMTQRKIDTVDRNTFTKNKKTTPKQSTKTWYNLFPWWGWIIAIVLTFLINGLLVPLDGLIKESISVALGVFALFALVALPVSIFVSIKNHTFGKKSSNKNVSIDSKANSIQKYAELITDFSAHNAKSLDVDGLIKDNEKGILMFVFIAYSLYITNIHLQVKGASNNLCDDVMDDLSTQIAKHMSASSGRTSEPVLGAILSTTQLFFQEYHPIKKFGTVDKFIHTLSKDLAKDYGKNYDANTVLEISIMLSSQAKTLNDTGFAKSI